MISIIVAEAQDGVIGSKNDLPWYLPDDLKHFRELTEGHTVIMGRNTFESIFARLGKALPNRRNIVVSAKLNPGDDYEVVSTLDEALELSDPDDETFIIGGAQLYTAALDRADKLYITEVDAEIEGDTYFPELNTDGWLVHFGPKHPADGKNQYPFQFDVWTRR